MTYGYFARAEALASAAIRDTYQEAKKVGRGAAAGASTAIAACRVRLERPKAVLDVQHEVGALTDAAYANELLGLA